ncbi:hypothetical protein OU415_09455 [Saccharopolyspora sp. WRP15-2]|uniref:Uncharacterized protein n=1 Tax=Saccharopolyspora oryzae TaxID=2997343 RepID=A0ABT4UVB4_9PSEU|nr:hypothetical protein [Saccharopolyspora oryzae]MDA3625661.1 hypothetical protein [Saccharopolyspora oryzae]
MVMTDASTPDIHRFHNRIAEVSDGMIFVGYLWVGVADVTWRHRGKTYQDVNVDMVLASSTGNPQNPWDFSDRADPDDADAYAELASGRVLWYGTEYSIRFLDSGEASRVLRDVFPSKFPPPGKMETLISRIREFIDRRRRL